MRDVLNSNVIYTYLKPGAIKRLEEIRSISRQTSINKKNIIHFGGNEYCILPWVGSRVMETLLYYLQKAGFDIKESSSYWVIIKTSSNITEILSTIRSSVSEIKDPEALFKDETFTSYIKDLDIRKRMFSGKFNEFIPEELLVKQYFTDFLDIVDLKNDLCKFLM
jgi:ATP-dependent Lhr-like helicase